MGFPKQEHWNGLPFPFPESSPGDLPDPGIKPTSPTLASRFFTSEPQGSPYHCVAGLKLISPSIHPSTTLFYKHVPSIVYASNFAQLLR